MGSTMVITAGITALLLSAVLGIFVLYFGYYLFTKLTRQIDEEAELRQGNPAVGIVGAGFIFSLGLIMETALQPFLQTLFNTAVYSSEGAGRIAAGLGLMGLQFLGTLLIAVLALALGLKVFHSLTRHIDEWAQIRQGNIAVALITAAMTVTLALFLRTGTEHLLDVIQLSPGVQSSTAAPFG